jgi:hypothetical protein
MLATDVDDYALLDVRHLSLGAPAEGESAAAPVRAGAAPAGAGDPAGGAEG